MRLIKINSRYTYEIESDYQIGEKIIFTDKCGLKGEEGTIVGIVGFEEHCEYVILYSHKIRGGIGQACLCKMGDESAIFSSPQIIPNNN